MRFWSSPFAASGAYVICVCSYTCWYGSFIIITCTLYVREYIQVLMQCRVAAYFFSMFLLLFFHGYYRFAVTYSYFWELKKGGFSLINFLRNRIFHRKKLRKVTRKIRQIFYVNFPIFFMLKFRNFTESPSQFLLNRSKSVKS